MSFEKKIYYYPSFIQSNKWSKSNKKLTVKSIEFKEYCLFKKKVNSNPFDGNEI